MNSQDIQKHPGFKRLQKLMEDPRYWKQQDPAYVEMIRQGFRDLYDSPVEAGLAANEAGVNGKIHAQDDEVAHVTRGEVVIPLSAQTPEVMKMLYQILGEDMIKYTVGSGHEQRNPTSGLAAFADQYGKPRQAWDSARDMWRNYQDMREANTKFSDQYFHCKANYDASSNGDFAERVAEKISDAREIYGQYIKRDSVDDMVKDQLANKHGRRAAKSRRYGSAKEACEIFRPNGLNDDY